MSGRALRAARLLCALACLAAGAAAATITTSDGWMRPAAAGTDVADVYVDIRTTAPVRLLSATSPWASRVELRAGEYADPTHATRAMPAGFALAAGTQLRFARYGNVVRFRSLRRNAFIGDTVSVTFRFRDARGRTQLAKATIEVHGLFNPPPVPPP